MSPILYFPVVVIKMHYFKYHIIFVSAWCPHQHTKRHILYCTIRRPVPYAISCPLLFFFDNTKHQMFWFHYVMEKDTVSKGHFEKNYIITHVISSHRQREAKILHRFRLLMMTSSNGNILRVTGPLCEELTGHRWIPLTKVSDAELRCFL